MKLEAFIPEYDENLIKKELTLFKENYLILLENYERILSCRNLFHCRISFSYMSTLYFEGGYIPLGVLLIGWEEGILRAKCPKCESDNLWILSFGGGLTFGWK